MQLQLGSGFSSRSVIGAAMALMLTTSAFAVDIVDDPQQIDDRAAQVVQASNSLCWEMHRYHQQQPNFTPTYRTAKEIYNRAGELRDALRAGPVETDALKQQLNELNDSFGRLEAALAKWGNGDRSQLATSGEPVQRTVVAENGGVDLPLLGIHVGGRQRVYVEQDDTPQLERHRLHPNSPGSKRSLQRELAATKLALSYLTEDANIVAPPNETVTDEAAPDASAPTSPTPEPPKPAPEATTGAPQKIPAVEKKSDAEAVPK